MMHKLFALLAFLWLSVAASAQGIGPTVSSSTLVPGTTVITGGTNTYSLYDNAGVLGERQTIPVANGGTNCTAASITCFNNITGFTAAGTTGTTSTNLVFSTSPTLVTPVLGVASATSLALGGCTIGANALCATGNVNISGSITAGTDVVAGGGNGFKFSSKSQISSNTNGNLTLSNAAFSDFTALQFGGTTSSFPAIGRSGTSLIIELADATQQSFITSVGTATLQHGAVDAAAPVAQTVGVQRVVAGTSNTAGALWTFKDSAGTGSAASGGYAFQVAAAGGSGTSQNTYSNALTIAGGTGVVATPFAFNVGGKITSTGSGLTINGPNLIEFSARTLLSSPSDGVFLIQNNAQTDFGRLQFGGTTSSFPALKRSSAALAVRLADDSADAALTAASINFGQQALNNYTATTWTPTITTDGTVGTPAYTAQVGSYERIGRQITLRFTIILSGWTGSPTGSVSVGGLPAAAANTASDYGVCTIPFYSTAGLAALNYGLGGYITANTSTITLQQNGAAASGSVTAAQAGTTLQLIGMCTYHV